MAAVAVSTLTNDERAVLMACATGKRIWDAITGDGRIDRVSKAAGALDKRGLIWDETDGVAHYYRATEAGIRALGEGM